MKRIICLISFSILLLIAGCSSGEEGQKVDENKSESTKEEQVAEDKIVKATIDGEEITQEEIEYECFRSILNEALTKENPSKNCPPEGTLISQIIQLKAVERIGEDWEISVTEEEVNERVNKLKEELDDTEKFHETVSTYGEDKFWENEKKRYYIILMSEKIKEKLIEQEKEKYASIDENAYDDETYEMNAQKKLEQMIMEAVGLLDIDIKKGA